tara:strand:- start:3882 stop:5978 length:2097 start_codon:yes stop_codon:yes gene_type:complete
MNLKNFANKTVDFIADRLKELIGLTLSIISLLVAISLLSYSPEDPNFIYSENIKINNILGFQGSFTSDFLFQSLGLISILFCLTIFFTGINIIRQKKILLIFENLFFTLIYLISGSFFFSIFYPDSFWLTFNGNGGFVGNLLQDTFLISIININKTISFYFLILITLLFFLISINFNLFSFLNFIKKFIRLFKIKKNNASKNEDIKFQNKEIDEIKDDSLVQVDLPFNQVQDNNQKTRLKYKLPSIDFLKLPTKKEREKSTSEYKIDESTLEKILLDFGVEGKIKKISRGPVVTLNEFEPAAGVKVSKIINLSEDIARNTSSESARISTIPGSNTIGIELPNTYTENVYLSEIVSSNSFSGKQAKLPIALGKNISGLAVVGDLTSMPHLLIAGTTGSGKSVCINTIILSLLYKHGPDKCKFILIDPKMLELSAYEGIPHLLCPVITEAKKAASVLGWVVKEMESRYKLMTRVGVKNIDGYNSKNKISMPYIVVIVDEMSDLMLVAGKEIENYIQKLSQMARAAGIHIIMATQRPSVDVITGTIKANFPTRVSFQVSSKIDSRTILGEQGAEQLLGKGDMLYMTSANKMIRIHGPFVSEGEIEKVNNFIRSQAEPEYVDEILNFVDEKDIKLNDKDDDSKDELYNAALEIVKSEGKASTSFLQRKLQIGYNRAARIIDMMESNGEVSKANHVGKRELLK